MILLLLLTDVVVSNQSINGLIGKELFCGNRIFALQNDGWDQNIDVSIFSTAMVKLIDDQSSRMVDSLFLLDSSGWINYQPTAMQCDPPAKAKMCCRWFCSFDRVNLLMNWSAFERQKSGRCRYDTHMLLIKIYLLLSVRIDSSRCFQYNQRINRW